MITHNGFVEFHKGGLTTWGIWFPVEPQELWQSLQKDSEKKIGSVDDDGFEVQWQEHYTKLWG